VFMVFQVLAQNLKKIFSFALNSTLMLWFQNFKF